jgi:hypothetical protein
LSTLILYVKIWLYCYIFNIHSVPYKLNRKHCFQHISFKIIYNITYWYKSNWSNRNVSAKYAWLVDPRCCTDAWFASFGLWVPRTARTLCRPKIIDILSNNNDNKLTVSTLHSKPFCILRKNWSIIYELQFRGQFPGLDHFLMADSPMTLWQI